MALDARQTEVKVHHEQVALGCMHDVAETSSFFLNCPGEVDILADRERPARKRGVAIRADFQFDVRADPVVKAESFTEHRCEIEVAAARHPVIDFLQRHDICLFGFADLSDALGVKFAVGADRLMDVICQNSNLHGSLRSVGQQLTIA